MKRGEFAGEQAGDQVEDLRADVIHIRRAAVLDPVSFTAPAGIARCLLISALCQARRRSGSPRPADLDPDLVHDLGQVTLEACRVGCEPRNRRTPRGRQGSRGTPRGRARRSTLWPGPRPGSGRHRSRRPRRRGTSPLDGRRLHPGELAEMGAYLPHLPGESVDGRQQAVIFQITEDLVHLQEFEGADVVDRLIGAIRLSARARPGRRRCGPTIDPGPGSVTRPGPRDRLPTGDSAVILGQQTDEYGAR